MARSPRALLIGAGLCAAAFVALLAAIYLSWDARNWDATAWQGFLGLNRPSTVGFSEWMAHLGDPDAVGLIGLSMAGLALARGKPRHAAAVIFLLALTSVSSQLLKAILDYPRYESLLIFSSVRDAAFPSGHSTAAMTLALCGVLVAPPKVRPLAALLGAGFAFGVGYSVVSLTWHFPSDVAGGFLLATGEALVVFAGLQVAARRWPEKTVRSKARQALARTTDKVAEAGITIAAAGAVLIGGLAAATLVLFRLPDVLGYAEAHTAFVLVASTLAAGAALLVAAVASTLSRR
jgi:membrane-associated phospholipid phosphatase